MTTHRLTPLKGSGWHRLGLLMAVGFLPVTAMLWTTDSFGGGDVGLTSAVIFYLSALVLSGLLGLAMPWAMKGFAVRAHGDGEEHEEDERPHRREAPGGAAGHGPAGHAPAHGPAHPPAAAGAHAAPARGGHAPAGHK